MLIGNDPAALFLAEIGSGDHHNDTLGIDRFGDGRGRRDN